MHREELEIEFQNIEGKIQRMAVVFCDIADYMLRAEPLSPESAVALIVPVLRRMVEIIDDYSGQVIRCMGDSILAVFGFHGEKEDDCLRAILATEEICCSVRKLGFKVRCGINWGPVYIGWVGSPAIYREISVIGTVADIAARLERSASVGEVVVSESVFSKVQGTRTWECRDVQLKNVSGLTKAYALMPRSG
jgi:adenylate cyclase